MNLNWILEKENDMQNPLRELQNRYATFLLKCCEYYAEGKRCIFEDNDQKLFDCSNCEHKDAGDFCRSNYFLKKVVRLIADYLSQNKNPKTAPLTQEQIDNFKKSGRAFKIESPLCKEVIWLVPEKTNKDRMEFTPEELNGLFMMSQAFNGRFLDISRVDEPVKESVQAELPLV